MRTLIFSVLLFIGSNAHALGDLKSIFDALKDKPVNYEPTGQICEQVARLKYAEVYDPSQFDLNVGVEYKVSGTTIGELDLVITNKSNHQVALVGEVKCWRNVQGALNKAHKQRARFISTLQSQGNRIVFLAKEGAPFKAAQFVNPKYVAISTLGTVSSGFDTEIEYSLDEMLQLRESLMRCQAEGKCPTE
ncbi:hypothetical protein [Bdellovibrio sp.]|uniref:hypothetical protein n=1 Tax=Bdellovibrio sp. TaxID=28201 RepID=UPI0039E4FC0F